MPDDQGRLFASDIAQRLGIRESDWRARVSRDLAPQPVARIVHGGAVRAVWDPATFAEYERARADRLQRILRPGKDAP